MKNSISILSVLIALAIVPSISCSAVSKTKPSPVLKPSAKPKSPTVPVIAKPKTKPGTVLWEFATENGQPVNSPALSLDEQTVFFGSGHDFQPSKKNGDGLYSIDVKTRKLKWRLFSKNGNQEFQGVSVAADGKVYTRYHDWGTGNTFIVVDPETQKQFLLNGAPRFNWLWASSMRGVVFGGNGKKINAHDVKSGTQQWSYLTKGNVQYGTIIDAENIVYVGSKDGIFYAIDGKNGSVVWKYQDDRVVSYSYSTSAIDNNGVLYTVAAQTYDKNGNPTNGMVIAIDKESGRKKWDFLLPAGAGVCAPIITSGGNIIIPAIGSIYALSQNTGDLKWNFKHRGGYNYKAGPLSAAVGDNGNIYFGSSDRFIYAIEGKTGNKVWTVRTGAPVVSAPLISNDGTLYIGSDDGRLYAIATGSSGPAKSPWPMYGQNAQRTNRAPAAK